MMSEVLEGIAVGGPRNGVKLTAPFSWDGLVKKPNQLGNQEHNFYPGKYKWEHHRPTDKYTWVWHFNEPKKKQVKTPTKM